MSISDTRIEIIWSGKWAFPPVRDREIGNWFRSLGYFVSNVIDRFKHDKCTKILSRRVETVLVRAVADVEEEDHEDEEEEEVAARLEDDINVGDLDR